jgi:hypothetical protein
MHPVARGAVQFCTQGAHHGACAVYFAKAAKALQQQRTGFDRALLLKPAANSHTDSRSSAAPKNQFLQAAPACVSAGQFSRDHYVAPTLLKGHTSHLNYECRSAQHPRNHHGSAANSSQQPAGASYMDHCSSFSALPAVAAGMQTDYSKARGAKSQGWRRDGTQPGGGYSPILGHRQQQRLWSAVQAVPHAQPLYGQVLLCAC